MLPRDQRDVLNKAFSQYRVIQLGKKDQQRPAPEPQPDECAKLMKVRRGLLRLQMVERIAAGIVMRLAVFGANKLAQLVAKCNEPEEIALPLCRQSQRQRRRDEPVERRASRAQARGVDHHVDFLSAL